MKKLIEWFKQSNRWKHLVGGAIIGILSNDVYCAILCGVSVTSVLEYKDKAHGGKWDWTDRLVTIGGVASGFLFRTLIKTIVA